MTISESLKIASAKLQPLKIACAADKSLGRLEAEILLAHVLKKDRIWLLTHDQELLPSHERATFESYVKRRAKHEPIAYILGEKAFYGRDFLVNKHTLIPRPETEMMVVAAIEAHKAPPKASTLIWDVGTGSGAIAISLAAELPDANILASDVSEQALRLARKNAKRHDVTKRIRFVKADLLNDPMKKILRSKKATPTSPQHLIIAANLPYLPLSDKDVLDIDVTKYEPSSALFCEREGLALIIRFLDEVAFTRNTWAFNRISLFFEFDPPQAKTLLSLAKKLFRNASITIEKDLAKRDRLLKIVITQVL